MCKIDYRLMTEDCIEIKDEILAKKVSYSEARKALGLDRSTSAVFLLPDGSGTVVGTDSLVELERLQAEYAPDQWTLFPSGERNPADRFQPVPDIDVEDAARAKFAIEQKRANSSDSDSFVPLSRAELSTVLPPSKAIVDDLFYSGNVDVVASDGSLGKTALMLDIALCMGTGQTFLGRDVAQGRVLFIEAEGLAEFERRISAWEIAHGLKVGSAGANIDFEPGYELGDKRREQLAETIANGGYSLVVLDTFSALFEIEDENSNAVIAQQFAWLRKMIAGTETTIVLVHHTTEKGPFAGAGKSSKVRGASTFRNNANTVVMISGTSSNFYISTRAEDNGKQKDGEQQRVGEGLYLKQIGDTVTGHVVIASGGSTAEEKAIIRHDAWLAKLTPGHDYSSGELEELHGRNKATFQADRSSAVDAGLIAKTGTSNKAPYRLVRTTNAEGEHIG